MDRAISYRAFSPAAPYPQPSQYSLTARPPGLSPPLDKANSRHLRFPSLASSFTKAQNFPCAGHRSEEMCSNH